MSQRKLENWLLAYEEYTQGTESPPLFHQWVGIGTLASAMQRKMYMDFGHYQVHSNMYIVLVSPAGRSRKSTALRIGQGLLQAAQDWGSKIHFSTQASSQAALVQQLSSIEDKSNQSLTAFSSELGSLLGSKSIEMIDFLVDIYDCNPNWSKQTVARGLEKIEKPWLNILAATTPTWMGDNLSKTAVEGGFVSRCIFVYEDQRLLVAFPQLTEYQRQLGKHLVHDLVRITELKGEFKLDSQAHSYYTDWYEDESRMLGNMDARVVGFYEREHIQVLKVAMALSIAQTDSKIIERHHVEIAVATLNQIKPGMHRAFTSVGHNPFSVNMERIRDLLSKFPESGLSYKQIFAANMNDMDTKQFDLVMNSLVIAGQVAAKNGRYYLASGNHGYAGGRNGAKSSS